MAPSRNRHLHAIEQVIQGRRARTWHASSAATVPRSSQRCPGSAATQAQDRGADLASFFILSRALTCVWFCHLPDRRGRDLEDAIAVRGRR